jgi:hypothetical protein
MRSKWGRWAEFLDGLFEPWSKDQEWLWPALTGISLGLFILLWGSFHG